MKLLVNEIKKILIREYGIKIKSTNHGYIDDKPDLSRYSSNNRVNWLYFETVEKDDEVFYVEFLGEDQDDSSLFKIRDSGGRYTPKYWNGKVKSAIKHLKANGFTLKRD